MRLMYSIDGSPYAFPWKQNTINQENTIHTSVYYLKRDITNKCILILYNRVFLFYFFIYEINSACINLLQQAPLLPNNESTLCAFQSHHHHEEYH